MYFIWLYIQTNLQNLFPLPAINRENTVRRQALHRLLIGIIHLIDRFCLRILSLCPHNAVILRISTHPSPYFRIIRDILRQNIHRALNRLSSASNLLVRVNITLSFQFQRALTWLLPNPHRERLQTALLRNASSRFPLLTIRSIKILDFLQFHGFLNRNAQLIRQFALLIDQTDNFDFPILEIT
ncbi:hypothetical protein D3C86_1523400 [compost metagenome]